METMDVFHLSLEYATNSYEYHDFMTNSLPFANTVYLYRWVVSSDNISIFWKLVKLVFLLKRDNCNGQNKYCIILKIVKEL